MQTMYNHSLNQLISHSFFPGIISHIPMGLISGVVILDQGGQRKCPNDSRVTRQKKTDLALGLFVELSYVPGWI